MREIRYLQIGGDVTAASASLVAGFAFRFSSIDELPALTGVAGEKILIYILVLLFSAYFCGLYERDTHFDFIGLTSRLAVSVMVAFFILSVLYYAVPALFIGRGFLSISLLLFGFFHTLLHISLKTFGANPLTKQKVLVYGAGELAARIEELINSSARRYYTFLGYILPEAETATVPEQKILGRAADIKSLVETRRPHTLVVSVADSQAELPVRELLGCKVNGVTVLDTASFFERVTGKLLLEEIRPNTFVFSNGFQLSRIMRILKRVMDISSAILGLLCGIFLLPLLAIVVKLDSAGPIFYKQVRVGENDKPFTIYKLRTMRQDAEKGTDAIWASEQDPRITRLGHFLRKTRLDETPQFYNI
ncbi:MAG: sugar transferase, partial [Desulfuromonadales bacterium]|nr:sugar transferase [Desulfuromonadales bacterium]